METPFIPADASDAILFVTPEETGRVAVFAWRWCPEDMVLEGLTFDGWREPFFSQPLGSEERLVERGGRTYDEAGECSIEEAVARARSRRGETGDDPEPDAPRGALGDFDVTASVAAVVFALAGAAAVLA